MIEAIGGETEDREHKLVHAPATLAATGTVGHPLATQRGEERNAILSAQLKKVQSVNWQRGPHWDGIVGKVTPKGTFTVAGSKEAAYAIFNALNDEALPAFAKVRQPSA